MEHIKTRVEKAAVRARQAEIGNDARLSAAASLDSLYALLGTAALYYWFGELHRYATPSRAMAAALLLSPLVAGLVLALRGHVLPILMHVQWGVVSAVAAVVPLLGFRSGDFQRLSWNSVAHVLFMLCLVGFAAGLCSLAGAELGGIAHGLRQRKALDEGTLARGRSWLRIRSFHGTGPRVSVVVALIAACAGIITAVIAKL
jgi:hypothetical protein